MANVQANGQRIEYEIRGEGTPVLFIMGLGGQLIDWPEEFLDLFVERGYQTIRFDNRDSGLSTMHSWKPASMLRTLWSMFRRKPLRGAGYTLTDMAADAVRLLEALDVEAAHVVGISMGGMIAQEMAIEHPERVVSMCSIMSNTGDRKNGGISGSLAAKVARQRPPKIEEAAEASVEMFALFTGPHFKPEIHREYAKAAVERSFVPDAVSRQTSAIAASRDRTELLRSVQTPTLVIHGLIDPLVKPSGGTATALAVPGSRLLAFPDMAHDLPDVRWPEFLDAIIANFDRSNG